jgi:hypothetical protein
MYTTPNDWLDTIREEYLGDYIKNGGAAVKFCVPIDNDDHDSLLGIIRKTAEDENFVFSSVDASTTKVHLIDKLFNEVARQIDWDDLSYEFIKQTLSGNGYDLPAEKEDFNIQHIAEINGREMMIFRNEFMKWLEQGIFHDFEMSQDLRIALIRLCIYQLGISRPSNATSNAIKEWLQGDLRLISTLKEALIFQKIGRHNARNMLFSLTHWLRVNGKSGLVLVLDISRYLIPKNMSKQNSGLFYSTPAVLDVYEVLRQFIDDTDEMEGLLVIVVAPKDFLVDEKRGLGRYTALKMRIWDEVRDKERQNPLASLIRISENTES